MLAILLGQLPHEPGYFREEFAGEEAERSDLLSQAISRARVEVDAPHGGLQRLGTPRTQPADDARQRVSRAGCRQPHVAGAIPVAATVRRRDGRLRSLEDHNALK